MNLGVRILRPATSLHHLKEGVFWGYKYPSCLKECVPGASTSLRNQVHTATSLCAHTPPSTASSQVRGAAVPFERPSTFDEIWSMQPPALVQECGGFVVSQVPGASYRAGCLSLLLKDLLLLKVFQEAESWAHPGAQSEQEAAVKNGDS